MKTQETLQKKMDEQQEKDIHGTETKIAHKVLKVTQASNNEGNLNET